MASFLVKSRGFLEFFVFSFDKGVLRALSNMELFQKNSDVLQGYQYVFVQYPILHWNPFPHHTEYFFKIILNTSVSLIDFFGFFRKDNFTFKCHRSDVSGSGQTQDVYAVSFFLIVCYESAGLRK